MADLGLSIGPAPQPSSSASSPRSTYVPSSLLAPHDCAHTGFEKPTLSPSLQLPSSLQQEPAPSREEAPSALLHLNLCSRSQEQTLVPASAVGHHIFCACQHIFLGQCQIREIQYRMSQRFI